jgi:DNA (cytosine-5)-methyltransferase 1
MILKIDKFKVKELMAKKKISTQKELAQMLGISKNQLSNILSDKFNPIKSNVMELANFLEVSPLELIEEKKETDELHRK